MRGGGEVVSGRAGMSEGEACLASAWGNSSGTSVGSNAKFNQSSTTTMVHFHHHEHVEQEKYRAIDLPVLTMAPSLVCTPTNDNADDEQTRYSPKRCSN